MEEEEDDFFSLFQKSLKNHYPLVSFRYTLLLSLNISLINKPNKIMNPVSISKYIFTLAGNNTDSSLTSLLTSHLKLNAVYWAQTALFILDAPNLPIPDVLTFLSSCYHAKSGGYGGNHGHDPHLMYTLSAIQVLANIDRLDLVNPKTIDCKLPN
jgi:prenyltransferase beta subunit